MSLLFEVREAVQEVVTPGWHVPPWEEYIRIGWGAFDDEWISLKVPTVISASTVITHGGVTKNDSGLSLVDNKEENTAIVRLWVAAGVGGHCEVTTTEFRYKMLKGHLVRQYFTLEESACVNLYTQAQSDGGMLREYVFSIPSCNSPLIRVIRTGDLGPQLEYTDIYDGGGNVVGSQPVARWREMTIRYWRGALTTRFFPEVKEYFPAGK